MEWKPSVSYSYLLGLGQASGCRLSDRELGLTTNIWDNNLTLQALLHVRTCLSLGIFSLLFLFSGYIERNPGPVLREDQWNAGLLTQTKRQSLEALLHLSKLAFCRQSETHFKNPECKAFSIAWHQHFGFARAARGGDVSLLIQDEIGILRSPEMRVMEVEQQR